MQNTLADGETIKMKVWGRIFKKGENCIKTEKKA